MDFGGQCAYYACHQVYLSRRAFYLLVIDMSKSFNERIDRRFCDQEETMFADWTYGEYLLFWMKSIHMYCAEAAPVILVGTHLDKSTGQTTDSFYNSIIKHLRFDKSLKKHLDRKRCFLVGFQSKNDPSLDDLSELMICIASIAKEDRWKETIPTDWALGESTLRYLRGQNRRVISKKDFQKECFGKIYEKYKQVPDILKLFHEIGVILNFKEGVLSETVIVDIQWLVDAFKNIITDLNHVMDVVENNDDWQNFYQNGYLSDLLLEGIWSTKGFKVGTFKSTILQYMQRLGLLVVGVNQHYIPCMNKCTFNLMPPMRTVLEGGKIRPQCLFLDFSFFHISFSVALLSPV
ncbi:probable serine/threonine-protein kinase roco6 isoform X1 [Saccostrea cucullata]|uniref:probable serine/threonine-protein kinase roco6 isoform X1 n=1 Tax=Saccostrea cuccullata TaxID=36930 RepID=UPI002ED10132